MTYNTGTRVCTAGGSTGGGSSSSRHGIVFGVFSSRVPFCNTIERWGLRYLAFECPISQRWCMCWHAQAMRVDRYIGGSFFSVPVFLGTQKHKAKEARDVISHVAVLRGPCFSCWCAPRRPLRHTTTSSISIDYGFSSFSWILKRDWVAGSRELCLV